MSDAVAVVVVLGVEEHQRVAVLDSEPGVAEELGQAARKVG